MAETAEHGDTGVFGLWKVVDQQAFRRAHLILGIGETGWEKTIQESVRYYSSHACMVSIKAAARPRGSAPGVMAGLYGNARFRPVVAAAPGGSTHRCNARSPGQYEHNSDRGQARCLLGSARVRIAPGVAWLSPTGPNAIGPAHER